MQYKKITIIIFLLLFDGKEALPYEDWSYELSNEAKQIYNKKEVQIPCSELPKLIVLGELGQWVNQDRLSMMYVAIRDAGLFKDSTCETYIGKMKASLKPNFKSVIAFYRLKMGDSTQIQVLVEIFDREARKVGDHPVVQLFGFLSDWEYAGRRLVRHADYSDGAASELLCSAIMWRRYLYGEEVFKKNWFKYGHEEKVGKKVLRYFYDTCALGN